MTPQQRFLLLLILVGGIATVLGLVSKRARFVPYPVVLALAGVLVGILPGTPLPRIGADLLLVAFVPGLVFEAALTLDLAELRRRLLPVGLLVTVGVALTVVLIGALTHLLVGFSWADGMLIGAILAATDPIAVVTLLRRVAAPAGLTAILEGESLLNDGTGVAAFSAVLGTIVSGSPSATDAAFRFLELAAGGAIVGLAVGFALLRTRRSRSWPPWSSRTAAISSPTSFTRRASWRWWSQASLSRAMAPPSAGCTGLSCSASGT